MTGSIRLVVEYLPCRAFHCRCVEQIIRTLFGVNTAFGQMARFSDRHPLAFAFSALAADCCSLPLFICNIVTRWEIDDYPLQNVAHTFVYLFIYNIILSHEFVHYGNNAVDFEKRDGNDITSARYLQSFQEITALYYSCNFIVYNIGVQCFN